MMLALPATVPDHPAQRGRVMWRQRDEIESAAKSACRNVADNLAGWSYYCTCDYDVLNDLGTWTFCEACARHIEAAEYRLVARREADEAAFLRSRNVWHTNLSTCPDNCDCAEMP